MPLLTDDLHEARLAYDALEERARSAESRAEKLGVDNARLLAKQALAIDPAASLRQRILDLEAETFTLRTQVQQLATVKSDLPLQRFIDALGLAAVLGEASMPERAIASIRTEVRTFLGPADEGVGLRFQQPELGALSGGLSTTSFEIVKVPPQTGAASPPNFHAVLQEMQRVYTDQFWLRFEEAAKIIVEVAMALSSAGEWSAQYLVQTASNLGALQEMLLARITPGAPAVPARYYGVAVDSLRSVANAHGLKSNLVAADIYTLTSALESATAAARALIP